MSSLFLTLINEDGSTESFHEYHPFTGEDERGFIRISPKEGAKSIPIFWSGDGRNTDKEEGCVNTTQKADEVLAPALDEVLAPVPVRALEEAADTATALALIKEMVLDLAKALAKVLEMGTEKATATATAKAKDLEMDNERTEVHCGSGFVGGDGYSFGDGYGDFSGDGDGSSLDEEYISGSGSGSDWGWGEEDGTGYGCERI